ncbi:energy transducer TonB [Novosphingobium sp.]|uniref:energy transducer TonB n=1 Tax=Novosphingobium sp. TaxID=1874826 RepID=UPI0025CD1435|nr:energy transducer TonB [Novosphingobium sp.]
MAYTDRTSGARRTGVALAVALLHGAAAVGLLSAFAGGLIQFVPKTELPTRLWMPVDPPTQEPTVTPTTTAVEHKSARDPIIPEHEIDLSGDNTINIIDFPTPKTIDEFAGGKLIDTGPTPIPSPSASFAPTGARPLGWPGLWVTDNDYPTGALRRGEQGVTGFSVTVGPDGRVRDCVVTQSSGSQELDRATCAKVSARARFAPAKDASGSAVTSAYANTIRWDIPKELR